MFKLGIGWIQVTQRIERRLRAEHAADIRLQSPVEDALSTATLIGDHFQRPTNPGTTG